MKRRLIVLLGLFATCFFLYSCGTRSLIWLEPYHSKKELHEAFPLTDKGEITIISHIDILEHFDLYEPDCYEKEDYCLYEIKIWPEQDILVPIEMISVVVTECGESVPFSVFYKSYPGEDEPYLVSMPFMVKEGMSHSIYVKIKKQLNEFRELSVKYQINIGDSSIVKKHQYRKQYQICSKHITFFKYWLHTCE